MTKVLGLGFRLKDPEYAKKPYYISKGQAALMPNNSHDTRIITKTH